MSQDQTGIDMREALGLSAGARGVLPSQALRRAVDQGIIGAGDFKISERSIQPASIDLRLGETVYRIRSSFLPDDEPVEVKLKELVVDEFSIHTESRVLEPNTPYLIPLIEELRLPPDVRGKANPKSSTGRLDVFTRVITDHSFRFDEIRSGYTGPLYLEVVPLSFTVKVKEGLALNQLRLSIGGSVLSDEELLQVHQSEPLLYRGSEPVRGPRFATANGLFLGLDLHGDESGRVGYRAKKYAPPIDMAQTSAYGWERYWTPVQREEGDRIILEPDAFYLLLSEEAVRIPPGYAAEMAAYDPTSGELRTHYAGFFDPGFGFDPSGGFFGSRAALEVRAHDVPFMIEHGQRVCKLTFERMAEEPDLLYGAKIGSSYQGQLDTLGKHFRRPAEPGAEDASRARQVSEGPSLFDDLANPEE
ncbi:MAG: 2'-deoxycytidine 5'-triphosphate deaminase [Actinomycetota bacterium]